MTEVFKVHPQCMWHGLTVKPLGLFPNRKQIKSSNLKKKSLLVHKEIKITRKNAIVDYLDYQITIIQLKGTIGNGNMQAAKPD